MGKIIADVTIVPLGTGDTSLSTYVADIEKTLAQKKGIRTLLTPMSTIIEGDLEEVWKIIREMHEVPFLKGARRVSTRISIDDRRDKKRKMEDKVRAVQQKLNE